MASFYRHEPAYTPPHSYRQIWIVDHCSGEEFWGWELRLPISRAVNQVPNPSENKALSTLHMRLTALPQIIMVTQHTGAARHRRHNLLWIYLWIHM